MAGDAIYFRFWPKMKQETHSQIRGAEVVEHLPGGRSVELVSGFDLDDQQFIDNHV